MILQLQRPAAPLSGAITLSGSKSISNRVLIIRALCSQFFPIYGLANAKDTVLMQNLLASNDNVLDAGAAGTTYRFLTALLATREGVQILTGTERMKQRPIKLLVEALRSLGADIQYLENEGYPPLRIGPPHAIGTINELCIPADTSSQYISALLLIAPTLPQGLTLHLDGHIVSRPYIEMTLRLMAYFGVHHSWSGNMITVSPQAYRPRKFVVEADWSAASYYYAMAALSDVADLQLEGLHAGSLQGDAVLVEMMRHFGVETTFNGKKAHITKALNCPVPVLFEWDFLSCPDLAQTMAVVCAGLGVKGIFSGLETLRIKETDRIAALRSELQKIGVSLIEIPQRMSSKSGKQFFLIEGKASSPTLPVFDTYEDHRMAMAFAPIAIQFPIAIREPNVVEKSYPKFWEDLQKLGFMLRAGATSLA